MSLYKLFFIFLKIGAILLGGGYVILPIMESEFVTKRHLVEYDELINYFALSQSLPGIIAANMTMFIGYKLKGYAGAFVAMIGVIFVPVIVIIVLASVISTLANNSHMLSVLWGISVAVIALISLTIREIFQKSKKDLFFYVIFIITLISLVKFKFSPSFAILIYVIVGLLIKTIINCRCKEEKDDIS